MLKPETPQEQAQPEQAQEPSQATEQDTTDVQSLIKAEVEKSISVFKNEIAGLNKKVSSVTKERDEAIHKAEQLELEKLSDEEKAKAELEKARKEKEQIEQETNLLKRTRMIDKALVDAGLPLEFAKRINGEDEESIIEDVKALNDYVQKYIADGIDAGIKERLSGKPPSGGAGDFSERDQLIAAYNEAEKQGNGSEMMKIKDQINRLPKE